MIVFNYHYDPRSQSYERYEKNYYNNIMAEVKVFLRHSSLSV